MRRSAAVLFVLTCLSLPFVVAVADARDAAPDPQASLRARVEALMGAADAAPFLNGGLLVARGGRIEFQAAAGMADFAAARPNDLDAVFQLASAAKPFTSVAVLQLRDRGLLRLDDPVARYLPGFPYPAITVRHLLGHTSGLPDLELFEPLVAADPRHVVTAADLVPALVAWKQPLRFAAGDRFRYSNINYQLLALLVERVSGQPFGRYVRDRIFRPAGMRASYVLGERALGTHRAPVANHVLAVMYQATPQDVRRLDYPDARMMRPYRYEGVNLGSTLGDQNVFATLRDLWRFDRALASGRLLSRASQEEAYAPVRLNDGSAYDEPGEYRLYGARCSYGLGWEVCTHPRRGRLVGHAGFNRGIATMLYRAIDQDRFVAMFDNGDTGDFNEKFAAIVDLANDDPPGAIRRTRSLTREYGRLLVAQGPAAALVAYNRLRADPAHWTGTPEGMNRLGYDLLHNGQAALALEPFRINLLLNPADANAYDSYGEALAAVGNTADAIVAYRRALELDPAREKSRAALRALEAGAGEASEVPGR